VSGDAAATAHNILAHESLYRFGGVADLISLAGDTVLALIFYELFRPVSKSLSLLAAFFRLVFVAVMAANTLNHFAALADAQGSGALRALRLHASGYRIRRVRIQIHSRPLRHGRAGADSLAPGNGRQ